MATVGAGAAAAAAEAAAHAQRLLVGGLLIKVPSDAFEEVARQTSKLVVTGTIGGWRSKKRLYLMPYDGLTFYCKTETDEHLSVRAIEVPKIDKGPLNL